MAQKNNKTQPIKKGITVKVDTTYIRELAEIVCEHAQHLENALNQLSSATSEMLKG